ncbi:MAG: T9SS type A sorting domain-containing protein [Ignavibacteria bacterium]|nr:T9SS type A sorting domain-containing protein [Ignavibacteria bacterium]
MKPMIQTLKLTMIKTHFSAMAILFLFILFSYEQGNAQAFVIDSTVSNAIVDVQNSSAAWGDFNSDGLMDVVICGLSQQGFVTTLYRNTGNNQFVEVTTNLPNVAFGDVMWADFDNDNDLDLLLTGMMSTGTSSGIISRIYQNNGGNDALNEYIFKNVGAPFPGIFNGSSAVGDYDNDGDLDVLLTGVQSDSTSIAALFKNVIFESNSGEIFLRENTTLPGVKNSSVAFGDFDNDYDLDIAMTGEQENGAYLSDVFRNDGYEFDGTSGDVGWMFSPIFSGMVPVTNGAVAWGDYDADGDLDIALIGNDGFNGVTKIYNNSAGLFNDTFSFLPQVNNGSIAWGNVDGSFYLGFVVTGTTNVATTFVGNVYRYSSDGTTGNFKLYEKLQGVSNGSSLFADYDDDNDLDILVCGVSLTGSVSRVYKNVVAGNAAPPAKPSNLISQVIQNNVFLQWNTVNKFPDRNSYNLRIGLTRGGAEIMSPMTTSSGELLTPQLGNTNTSNSWRLHSLKSNKYYWSVVAINNRMMTSPYSVEDSFYIGSGVVFGTKFYDFNGNGVQEFDENGIEKWKIYLSGTSDAGVPVSDTVYTDESGKYTFPYLPAGAYTITEADSSEYKWMSSTQSSFPVIVPEGGVVGPFNFGNFKLGTITGTVFADVNNDSVRDPLEKGIAGFKIILQKTSPLPSLFIDTIVSDNFGRYILGLNKALTPGNYQVTQSFRRGFRRTYPVGGSYDTTIFDVSVIISNLDFGNVPIGVLIDTTRGDTITWDDMSNWENGLPTGEDSVVIPINSVVVIDSLPSGNDSVSTLHITAGSRLKVKGGKLKIRGHLYIDGDLEIDSIRRPNISVYGDFRMKGKFKAGKSHVKLLGAGSRFFGKDTAVSDDDTTSFYDLTLGSSSDTYSDSAISNGTIKIQRYLNVNRIWKIQNNVDGGMKTAQPETVYVENDDPAAVAYGQSGSIANGVVNRRIRANSTGVYKFHSVNVSLRFSGSGTYPYRMKVTKLADSSLSPNTFFVFKSGTVNTESTFVRVSNIQSYSRWAFGQVGHKTGDTTGGPLFDIEPEEVSEEKLSFNSVVAYSPAEITLQYNPSLLNGIPIDSLGLLKSTTKKTFRTFKASSELSAKVVQLKYSKGLLTSQPNIPTAVENVFKKIGKSGTTFLGIPQTNSDSAKRYAWILFKKGSDLGKLYTSAHTGTKYPLDSTRDLTTGKGKKKLVKAVKPDRKKYNNPAWEQGILFNLNLIASADSITPPGFGSLVLDTSFVFFGRQLQGKTLSTIAKYMDSVMTYWYRLGVDNSSAYSELGSFIDNIVAQINNRFYASMQQTNYEVDSIGVVVQKNPYAVKLKGVFTAAQSNFLTQVDGKDNGGVHIPNTGFFDAEPTTFELFQNYPNPFNPSTALGFSLGQTSFVTLKIYNILGQEIRTVLNNEMLEEGMHEIEFDATQFSSGVYFYRMTGTAFDEDGNVTTFSNVRKMIVLK